MKNRRFALVIMDSTGRNVRRLSIARRNVEVAAGIAGGVALILLLALGHGLWLRSDAQEAQQIVAENRELKKIVKQLESHLPQARALAMHTELTFTQLWAKSGLGAEPRLLSMGPLEQADLGAAAAPVVAGNDLLSMEPVSLPLELDRIEEDGLALQSTLGETLEYFHDAEQLLSNTPSVRPTNTPWLTSSFGKRRDPIFNYWVMHKGLDMAGHIGLQIYAPADGVVIWTGKRGGYGVVVVIDHGYGLQTHYAHLSKYLVAPGQHVRRGDLIAEMGSTGKSTGPHLHYEVRYNGQPLDPRRFILD